MRSIVIILVLSAIVFTQCSERAPEAIKTGYLEMRGPTQGTTYQIIYKDSADYSYKVDSILAQIDREFNLWMPNSIISQFNAHTRTDTVFAFKDSTMNFTIMMEVAKDLYKKTNKTFDPSVLPLLKLWNFGKDIAVIPTQQQIDSVLEITGFTEFDIALIDNPYVDEFASNTEIRKSHADRKLDFNAIAQGYTSDMIGNYFDSQNVTDYMVNVGGEIKVKGINPEGKSWTIGIQNPSAKGEEAESLVTLTNCGVATSGSYRNFKEINGKKYSHMIDGRTGYPVQHNLLSCTIIAETAYEADAFATAFMVMGTLETHQFLYDHPDLGLEVYLIEDGENGLHVTYTPNFPLVLEE